MSTETRGTRGTEERAAHQAEATRHEILQHATDLFKHYGFGKTSIGDIAERCAMSPGNIYRYYHNKQAIGVAAVAGYFETVETAMDAELKVPEGTAEERIRRFLVTGIGHLVRELEHVPKIVEMADFMCENVDGLAVLNEHIDWKRRLIAREIEKGIAAGEFAACDPGRTAAIVLGAIKVFFIPMVLIQWKDRTTILPELNDILDLLFSGLKAR